MARGATVDVEAMIEAEEARKQEAREHSGNSGLSPFPSPPRSPPSEMPELDEAGEAEEEGMKKKRKNKKKKKKVVPAVSSPSKAPPTQSRSTSPTASLALEEQFGGLGLYDASEAGAAADAGMADVEEEVAALLEGKAAGLEQERALLLALLKYKKEGLVEGGKSGFLTSRCLVVTGERQRVMAQLQQAETLKGKLEQLCRELQKRNKDVADEVCSYFAFSSLLPCSYLALTLLSPCSYLALITLFLPCFNLAFQVQSVSQSQSTQQSDLAAKFEGIQAQLDQQETRRLEVTLTHTHTDRQTDRQTGRQTDR
jgi:hypothetical protein